MNDQKIVELYWQRDENAIKETDRKYGEYLLVIADNIVHNRLDSEECLNDTYVSAWNSMPPHRPDYLKAFLSTIIRRHSLLLYRNKHSQKREGISQAVSLSDLEEIISDEGQGYAQSDAIRLSEIIEQYLDSLDEMHRYVFISRFYYGKDIGDIAQVLHAHRSKINRAIAYIRKTLRQVLEEEGYTV